METHDGEHPPRRAKQGEAAATGSHAMSGEMGGVPAARAPHATSQYAHLPRLHHQEAAAGAWRNVIVGQQGQVMVLEVPSDMQCQLGGLGACLQNMQQSHPAATGLAPPTPHSFLQHMGQQSVGLTTELLAASPRGSLQRPASGLESGQQSIPLSLLPPSGLHASHMHGLGRVDSNHFVLDQQQLAMLLSRDGRAPPGLHAQQQRAAPPRPGILNFLCASSAAAAAAACSAPAYPISHAAANMLPQYGPAGAGNQAPANIPHYGLAGDAAWAPALMVNYSAGAAHLPGYSAGAAYPPNYSAGAARPPGYLDFTDTTALHRRPSLREDEPSLPSSLSTGRLSSRSTGKSDSKRGRANSNEDESTGHLGSPSRRGLGTTGLGASPSRRKKQRSPDSPRLPDHASDKEKNRQAQQRFRERQKVMITALQEEVNMLHKKLAEAISRMWLLEKENIELRARLEASLSHRPSNPPNP